MMLSSCCGAKPASNGDSDSIDFGLCPDCHDHCEFVDDDEVEPDHDAERVLPNGGEK